MSSMTVTTVNMFGSLCTLADNVKHNHVNIIFPNTCKAE
jgi:hypothetical protein